jgi:Arc/MetJ family transcription regulator
VSKTLIDIDDDLLDKAGAILGTATKKDAVNRALREVVDREERAKGLQWLHDTDALGALRDPDVRGKARR